MNVDFVNTRCAKCVNETRKTKLTNFLIMKNRNLGALCTALAIVGLPMISSCSEDDKTFEGDGSSNSAVSIVGTWKVFSDDDVYVFKSDGTGIGCEHAESVEQDIWTFQYSYNQDTKTITIRSDETEVCSNVTISGDMLYCTDENEEELTMYRQSEPVVLLSLDVENLDFNQCTGNENITYGSDAGEYELTITGRYLWHKELADRLKISVFTLDDNNGMLSGCETTQSVNKSVFTFNLSENTNFEPRVATIKLVALNANDEQLSSIILDIWQASAGKSMEVDPPMSIPGEGGTVSFIVYNKDQQDITATYPYGQTVKWTKLSSIKYSGGADWQFDVTASANRGTTTNYYDYSFKKGDGSSFTFTLSQSPQTGGGSNEYIVGTVSAETKVIGPGLAYDSEAQFINNQTCTIEYKYYPSSGKYYIYGGIFCSDPNANNGKGVRFDAKKGYNSICIRHGVYFSYYPALMKYNWDVYLKFTLP